MEDGDGTPPSEPDGGSAESAAETTSLPWRETKDREFKDIFASGLIALLLAVVVVGLLNGIRDRPGNHLGSAAFAVVLASVAIASWYGPFGTVGLIVSVDKDALSVRHMGWRLPFGGPTIELTPPKQLPVAEIGSIELVAEHKRRRMWMQALSLTYRGRPLGWTRVTVDRETTEAVLVEQLGADLRRPWWLVKCTDCEGLIAALEEARASTARA